MERYKYDFHMHSCLSPCGDNDMTPNNLVGMAKLMGFDMIALTDHNSCKNTPAAVKIGEAMGITVVPGMELCTSEEAHVVCLFPNVERALEFDGYVSERIPDIKNKPEIFGEQLIMDEDDNVIGHEDRLLITSSFIGVNDVKRAAESFGGTAFPAHVNRDSYSVVASLGVIPPECGFTAAEITSDCDFEAFSAMHPELEGLKILTDSDTHYLENFHDPGPWVELPERSAAALIELINGKGGGDFSPFGVWKE